MKLAALYPEGDGELHITTSDEVKGPFIHRTITFTVAVDPSEKPEDTLRTVGLQLQRQPLKRIGQ